MSFRVAYEEGNGCTQHAEDHQTEDAAKIRVRTLNEAGISRAIYYEVAGNHEAPCMCGRHGPGIKPTGERVLNPYYQDDLVTLYHGDCQDVPQWLEADTLVTDPPYGIDYRSNQRRQTLARSIDGDADTRTRDRALRAWRQHASGGEIGGGMWRPALMFGTWRRPKPMNTKMLLIWDTKGALGMGDTSLPWKPAHQEIYVLGRGFVGHRGSDVLTCAPVQSLGYNGRVHPHEKPVDLMAALIRKCPPGVIADPFAGSGATLVAARMEGRRAIGVEVREAYCEVIAKRLQTAQDTLFGGAA